MKNGIPHHVVLTESTAALSSLLERALFRGPATPLFAIFATDVSCQVFVCTMNISFVIMV